MTRDDIIRLAREAGDDWEHTLPTDRAFLERFAALVAAERAAISPPQVTHAEGCWSWGPAHYLCAYREIVRLREEDR